MGPWVGSHVTTPLMPVALTLSPRILVTRRRRFAGRDFLLNIHMARPGLSLVLSLFSQYPEALGRVLVDLRIRLNLDYETGMLLTSRPYIQTGCLTK